MNFKEKLRKGLEGEKVVLDSISDEETTYYFFPRKFSIDGQDAINNYKLDMSKSTKATAEARAILKKYYDQGLKTEAELLNAMTQDEALIVLTGVEGKNNNAEKLRVYLRYGVGKNNINDKAEEVYGLAEKYIDAIVENTDLANTMFKAIEGLNSFF